MTISLENLYKQKNKVNSMSNAVPGDNFIYFHHTGDKIVIPVDPEAITDSMSAGWASSTPLSRSAPIYSYQNSGPRSVQLVFDLHRDLMKQFNPGEKDAVELLIKYLEECVLPTYKETAKVVNPPIVSVKIRDEIYIKGIVTNVGKNYKLPIINYGKKNPIFKYALVNVNFGVQEITPIDASIVRNIGGYRDI